MIKSEQQKRFSNLVGVDADGNSESPGQAEVGDLDGALAIDQQVLRLQVSVKNAALNKKFKVQRSKEGLHTTEVAFMLHNLQSRVQFLT